MQKTTNPYSPSYFLLLSSLLALALVLLGYATPRVNFGQLLGCYSLAFLAYAALLRHPVPFNLRQLLWMALGLRLLLSLMLPNLSDDYFRFIWDGRLWTHGVHPFAHRPEALLEDPIFQQLDLKELYYGDPKNNWAYFQGLNSKNYYSVYPSINQLIFGISTYLSPKSILGSVVIMRSFMLLAEWGTLYFSIKLIRVLKLPSQCFLYYAFNPLMIMELTGNLHFEGIALCFFSMGLYFLLQQKTLLWPQLFAASIATKLLPLLSLPLIWSYLGWKKGFSAMLLLGLSTLLLLAPIYYQLDYFQHFLESVGLYFGSFEFNASFYYLLKWISGFIWDYPPKTTIATLLSTITFLSILYLSVQGKVNRQNLFYYLLIGFSLYLLTTRTVHPWYLTFIIWLCTFSTFRYPLLWSYLITWSYYALSRSDYAESYLILLLEYVLLAIFIGYEWRARKSSA